jgi:hypothetical protein
VGSYCVAGTCAGTLASGVACDRPRMCTPPPGGTSGFCVDNVCCNGPCTGLCQACNVSGSVGTCTNVGADQDLDAECSGSGTCGGTCNGRGGCQFPPTSRECAAASCTAGVRSAPRRCDGSGDCAPAVTASCSPYLCAAAGSDCATSCGDDSQCAAGAPGFYCAGGGCVEDLALGSPCDRGAACASGSCKDGVCCESACDGLCRACDVAGALGRCSFLAQGTDPADECAGGGACGGTCDVAGTCRFPQAQSFCGLLCADATLHFGVCDGAGACGRGTVLTTCSQNFACRPEGDSCYTSCTSDDQCAPGNFCIGGECRRRPNGDPCTAASQCADGNCVEGVCCNTACDGACEDCNLPGSPGTCTPLPLGSPGSPPCAPYVCTGSAPACPTTCSSDADCTPDTACTSTAGDAGVVASCTAKQGLGQPCDEGLAFQRRTQRCPRRR